MEVCSNIVSAWTLFEHEDILSYNGSHQSPQQLPETAYNPQQNYPWWFNIVYIFNLGYKKEDD